ncbi:MAG: SDR family oxidoreductase, partial [Hyphomicrobiaceae bacterium]
MMLQDKVCLVVGAASLRGIGYATAELFARHGAKLAVVDVAMDDTATAAIAASITAAIGRAPTIIGLQCDIQSSNECKQVVGETAERLGGLDCLVNCAGIVRAQSMLSIEEADYDRILGVNLKGTFNICQAVLNVFAS